MKRRKFISLLGSAAAWPLAARAQAPAHVYRLGVMVGQARDSAMVAAFFDELRVLGFIEGQTRNRGRWLRLARRTAPGAGR